MKVEAGHALLSASGSKRWLSCPPSARLEEQLPEERSEYADEGSFAHELAELILRYEQGYLTEPNYDYGMAEMKESPFYSTEMLEHVKKYVDLVHEKINTARGETRDVVVLIEQYVDYSPWVPNGFGTGDLVIIGDGILEVVDFKYGKGVPVPAEGNSQMRLYALGAFDQFCLLYSISAIRMTICQPRLDNISTVQMPVEEFLTWGESIIPIATKAFAGEGAFSAGEHCRFCRARSTCRECARANLELAKMDFRDPN